MGQYSFDALRLATHVPGQDTHGMALGNSSVATYQGFGSILANPAVAAQANKSMVTFGVGIRDVRQTTFFPGIESMGLEDRHPHNASRTTFDDQQTGITHAGFLYKVPTVVGNLAVGGGYNQTADMNSAYRINHFNEHTSLTYRMLSEYQDMFDLAFNTFAVENIYGRYESVFDFGGFFGVGQYGEVTRRGQSGEYSLFISTEFQKDFFVGLTLGIPVSNSVMEFFFIEESPMDQHGDPIYSGEQGTGSYNIDQLMFEEKLKVDAVGVNVSLGLLYTGLPMLDIGVSYKSRTRWSVDETFDVFIQTRFWDVVTFDGDVIVDDYGNTFGPTISNSFRGEYSYNVTTPARLNLGFATKSLPFVNLSFAAERIDYGRIELRDFDTFDREIEIEENKFIDQNFNAVWNLRAGAAISLIDGVEPRFGWAWQRNPVAYIEDNERHYLSAGLGIGLNQSMTLDLAFQYGFWNTTDDVYSIHESTGLFQDEFGRGVRFYETADQEIDRYHLSVGLSLAF